MKMSKWTIIGGIVGLFIVASVISYAMDLREEGNGSITEGFKADQEELAAEETAKKKEAQDKADAKEAEKQAVSAEKDAKEKRVEAIKLKYGEATANWPLETDGVITDTDIDWDGRLFNVTVRVDETAWASMDDNNKLEFVTMISERNQELLSPEISFTDLVGATKGRILAEEKQTGYEIK